MQNTSISVLFVAGSATLLTLGGCGELDRIDDGFGELAFDTPDGGDEEALSITGHVVDYQGRPLWNLGVELLPEEPGATTELELSSFTWVDGHYDLEVPATGRYTLRFTDSRMGAEEGETLALVAVDTRVQRVVDIALERADVMSCQLLDDQGTARHISSYGLWATNPSAGRGVGGSMGGCGGTSDCGPTAITFFWPSGFERVELRLDQGEPFELSGPDAPCDVVATEP